MRTAQIERTTAETSIQLKLNLDGSGKSRVDTGCGFLDHMLTLFSHHGRIDLDVTCQGDTHVDYHHTVEDVGIVLGTALESALSEKRGINRYGSMLLPMDEALVLCALDLSGRSTLVYGLEPPTQKVGDFDTELASEFFLAVSRTGQLTLNLQQITGSNSHHIIEAAFKAFGRALREAVAIDTSAPDEVPSTKGVLS